MSSGKSRENRCSLKPSVGLRCRRKVRFDRSTKRIASFYQLETARTPRNCCLFGHRDTYLWEINNLLRPLAATLYRLIFWLLRDNDIECGPRREIWFRSITPASRASLYVAFAALLVFSYLRGVHRCAGRKKFSLKRSSERHHHACLSGKRSSAFEPGVCRFNYLGRHQIPLCLRIRPRVTTSNSGSNVFENGEKQTRNNDIAIDFLPSLGSNRTFRRNCGYAKRFTWTAPQDTV